MSDYRIYEAKTGDGEPSGIWHICRRGEDGLWSDAIGIDFDSITAAVDYASENGITIEE